MPVTILQKKGEPIVVSQDEHPRATTIETLGKLKGVVRADGTVTAGNASGVNDGACALLMANEANARKNFNSPRARVVGMATAGVAPRIMGIERRQLRKTHSTHRFEIKGKWDVIELNEAFTAPRLGSAASIGFLRDDDERVNAWGGAIAFVHWAHQVHAW